MRDPGLRPAFRSDRLLVELRDPRRPLPSRLAALCADGGVSAVHAPWTATEVPPVDVDPRVHARLRAILDPLRVLHLDGVTCEQLLEELAQEPGILRSARVPLRTTCAARRRARLDCGWHLEAIRLRQARRLPGFRDAIDIHVALVDSGLDATHPDLKRHAPRRSGATRDAEGHGTHAAGLILGGRRNRFGLRGICGCRLTVHGVAEARASLVSARDGFRFLADESAWLSALAQCARERVDVVDFGYASLGEPHFAEQALLDLLLELGCALVAPMGNDRVLGSPTAWPAAHPGVIAVAASSIDDRVAVFSSAGAHVALAAPGVGIWSTAPIAKGVLGHDFDPGLGPKRHGAARPRATRHMEQSGTSSSAALVTAAIALLLASRGRDTPAHTRAALQASAFRRGGGRDHDLGAGVLDLDALLRV
ncbi:MAG: S8 family serine peptidase [Planctomycetota bacterium]